MPHFPFNRGQRQDTHPQDQCSYKPAYAIPQKDVARHVGHVASPSCLISERL